MTGIGAVGSTGSPYQNNLKDNTMSHYEENVPTVHKNHDGLLILGVLGAAAATVATVLLIKKGKKAKEAEKAKETAQNTAKTVAEDISLAAGIDINKLEKEVFDPLKNFKGSKVKFAEKAYELLTKAYDLEGVAPKFNTVKEEKQSQRFGYFSHMLGEINMPSEQLKGTHEDILGILAHELKHFMQFGEVLSNMGIEKFANTAEKNSKKIFLDSFSKNKKLSQAIKKFNESGEDFENSQFIQKLIKKTKTDKSNFELNRSFWRKYISEKGQKTSKETNDDTKLLIEQFEKYGKNSAKTSLNEPGSYLYYKDMLEYHNNPFEKPALEAQFEMTKAWDEFLCCEDIKSPKAQVIDDRPFIASFEKIENHLKNVLPEEKARAKGYDLLMEHAMSEKKTDSGDVLFEIINDGLQKPDSTYNKVINLYAQIDKKLEASIKEPQQRFEYIQGLQKDKILEKKTKKPEEILKALLEDVS